MLCIHTKTGTTQMLRGQLSSQTPVDNILQDPESVYIVD